MKLSSRLLSAVPTKVNYAPLAKGPLPPPPLMRNVELNSFKAQSAPFLVLLCGAWAGAFYFFHERPKKKIYDFYRDLDPEAVFHQIKEYGIFHSVRASWQEDGAEDGAEDGDEDGDEE